MTEQEKLDFAMGVMTELYNAMNLSLTSDDALLLHRMFRCLNEDYQQCDDPQVREQLFSARTFVIEWLNSHDSRDHPAP